MAYIDAANLAIDPLFYRRVEMAAVKAAIQIGNEDPATANHAARAAFAARVLAEPDHYGQVIAFAVATNPTIAANGNAGTPDGDIDFVVISSWGAYLG